MNNPTFTKVEVACRAKLSFRNGPACLGKSCGNADKGGLKIWSKNVKKGDLEVRVFNQSQTSLGNQPFLVFIRNLNNEQLFAIRFGSRALFGVLPAEPDSDYGRSVVTEICPDTVTPPNSWTLSHDECPFGAFLFA